MGSITDFLEDELLDHVLGVGAYTPAATLYLAISTADPTDDGSGLAEPATANSYARKAISFDAAASRSISQTSKITFDEVTTATWNSCGYWAICDNAARATGNVLAHGAFSAAKTPNVGAAGGDIASVPAGEITISFSAGEISDYLANKLLDFAFRNQAYSQPTIYVAACDVDIDDDDTGSTISEPSDGYARVAHAAWNAAASGVSTNDGDIEIGPATSSWGAITAGAILDALTNGNLLFYDNAISETIAAADGLRFPDTMLSITMT